MKTICLTLFLAPLLMGVSMYAQAGSPPERGPGMRGFGEPPAFGMGPHLGKVVTGAPYSATSVDVFTQTLVDGNTIQHTNTAQVARDSMGRTYSQRTMTRPDSTTPTVVISIFDPVAGYSYALNPDKKVAYRRAIKTPPAGATTREHVRAERIPGTNPNAATASLGTKAMNGVNAEGVTKTVTIPAGQMGNAAPLVRTSTTWTSPELQVVVHSVNNDPVHGQSTHDLTNLQPVEPAANLFQVPSDYTVVDAPGWGGAGLPRGPRMQ